MSNGSKKNCILQEISTKSTEKNPEKKEEKKEKKEEKEEIKKRQENMSYIDKPIYDLDNKVYGQDVNKIRVRIFEKDVRIEKNFLVNEKIKKRVQLKKINKGGGRKKALTKLSDKSMRNMKFTCNNMEMDFQSMITLTYPKEYETNGKIVKKHLKYYMEKIKRRYPDYKYFWFLEFQKRGAPHYHILTDINIKDIDSTEEKIKLNNEIVEDLHSCWIETVNSEDTKHIKAGTRIEAIRLGRNGMASYVRKYAKKKEQKEVPENYTDVGRFWGTNTKKKEKEIFIDNEEFINIRYKYENFVRNKFPNSDMKFLDIADNLILWNFKREVEEEIREELMKSVQGERADARDNLSEETEPFTLNSKSNEKPS